jgi:phosphoribosyl 1,2-cyclic phosphodiesterase
MTLKIIGSSSSGNSYALIDNDSNILLLESGCPFRELEKAIDYNVGGIVGLCVSHRHSDHAKYIKDFMRRINGTLVCNYDVIESVGPDAKRYKAATKQDRLYKVGPFKVMPFLVEHDAPCFGFLIFHDDMGPLMFATDTYTVPKTFKGIKNYMIEANYDDDILQRNMENGIVNPALGNRLMTSHLSIGNCILTLKRCHAEEAGNIILIHLSAANSNSNMFRDRIVRTFGVPTFVANKGLEINLDKQII